MATVVISTNKYGWHNPYYGIVMPETETRTGTENVQPTRTALSKLLKCSTVSCPKVESRRGEFKICTNCLTTYCSRDCQLADWNAHKAFCKSDEAYFSHLDAWQATLSPEILGDCLINGPIYLATWEKWTRTEKMKKVLTFIGKTEDHFNPYKDGLYTS